MGKPINIIFDGPPGHDAPCFVEVETDDGKSIKIGEWIQKGNYWALRITAMPTEADLCKCDPKPDTYWYEEELCEGCKKPRL